MLKAFNYEDISATTLDWSTENFELKVSSEMVLSFLRSLDFNRICSELVGKKTVEEILSIVCKWLKKYLIYFRNASRISNLWKFWERKICYIWWIKTYGELYLC